MSYTKIGAIILFVLLSFNLAGQTVKKETRVYAVREGQELKLDIYKSNNSTSQNQPCIIYVFGGGFKEGTRDFEGDISYFNYFAERGFTVISIDYRLGMAGQKAPSLFNFKPLTNAISLAVSDLYTATSYLLENANELNIDPSLFILSGSSAGAVTVLHADYEERDNHSSADVLPEDFKYAGVISFAGGIFSSEGLPSYDQKPAPTMFFHGSADKLVIYNKTRLFKTGMFGSAALTKRFRQEKYPYVFYSYEGLGHEVSSLPMKEFLPDIEKFINELVVNKEQLMIDINYIDLLHQPETSDTPETFYN